MLTNHEIDAASYDEHMSTLVHKAAMSGQLAVVQFLVMEGGLHSGVLQAPDESFTTPAMLAIQVCGWVGGWGWRHVMSCDTLR